jgi:hypothetical protein
LADLNDNNAGENMTLFNFRQKYDPALFNKLIREGYQINAFGHNDITFLSLRDLPYQFKQFDDSV